MVTVSLWVRRLSSAVSWRTYSPATVKLAVVLAALTSLKVRR
jgi:hypothetical protein